MKKTFLAAGLVVVFGSGLVGCKTTPKLAFWKKDAADATAVASTAPALPSDLAKQGSAAGATVAQARTTEAAPFVPGQVARASATTALPSSYPSTDAPPFTPDLASRIAASPVSTPAPAATAKSLATPSAMAPSSNLGSIAAAPYNPSATPAPAAPPASTTPSLSDSRYGAAPASAPLYGQPPIGSMANTSPSASTPPASTGSLAADSPSFGASAGADRYVAPTTPTTGGVDRYGSVADAAAQIPASLGATSPSTATAVATATPYRPGGTSNYSSGSSLTGAESTPQIALRTQESTAPPASGGTVPNVARPGSAGVTQPAPSTPTTTQGRYW